MARLRIDRHISRRDFPSGTAPTIAAEPAPLAELRADSAAQNALVHHNVRVLAMSRTPFFAAVKKALAHSFRDAGIVGRNRPR